MIKEIQTFCAVVQHKSLVSASRQLHISPPMVTRHLQKLESNLSAKLIQRTTRGMSVTEAGARFYEEAQHILMHYESGRRLAQGQAHRLQRIKIAVPTSIVFECILPKLKDFKKNHPNLILEIIQGNHLPHMIDHGFDCVIFCGDLPDSHFYYTRLGQWEKRVCASPEWLSSHGNISHPKALLSLPCLLHSHNHDQCWSFYIDGKKKDFYIHSDFKTDSSMLLAQMAVKGLGLAYLPSFTIDSYLKNHQLITICDDFMPKPLDIFAIYPSQAFMTDGLKTVIEFFKLSIQSSQPS